MERQSIGISCHESFKEILIAVVIFFGGGASLFDHQFVLAKLLHLEILV